MLASPVVVLFLRNDVFEGLFDELGASGSPQPSATTIVEFTLGCDSVPKTKMPSGVFALVEIV